MRGMLLTLLTLGLLTATLPGVAAETYRYVATGLPVECQDDPLGTYDGICPGPIRIEFPTTGTFAISFTDDVWGANAAYTVCFEDATGACITESDSCGPTILTIPTTAVALRITFLPLLVDDDLNACGATTGELTVDPVA